MNNLLTIEEIEEMEVEELERMMTSNQVERMHKLGFAEYETFLNKLKDDAVLTGLEDDDEFMTIDEYLQKLEMEQSEYETEESEEIEEMEEKQETSLVSKEETEIVNNFSGFTGNMNRPEQITNIHDKKQLFNLGKKVDKMLNDCEGKVITIDKILIKKYQKEIDEPVVNEETGEIISDTTTKTSMSIVIVDKDGTSYATGSKTFGYSLLNCINDFGDEVEGLQIRIIKTMRAGSSNKSLDFELV